MDKIFKFSEFVDFLLTKIDTPVSKEKLIGQAADQLYALSETLKIPPQSIALFVADFCHARYYPFINPELVDTETLSPLFCRQNSVVAIREKDGKVTCVLSNPFNRDLMELLNTRFGRKEFEVGITDSTALSFLVADGESEEVLQIVHSPAPSSVSAPEKKKDTEPSEEASGVIRIANNILRQAIIHRASDIHIEPKPAHMTIRFRIDGELRETYQLKTETGAKLISRFKVFGGLDIAERRKPQDGSVQANISGRTFKLRLATTSTPNGESLIIRLLDPTVKPKSLIELGMTKQQSQVFANFARLERGLILIVGPTGAGKTTTIYTLLSQIDCQKKSLISVEDPIEYRIPMANQQQVNEKAGINFETLLKSSVRQDPDILFVGEIRDGFSAKACIDFASTGHLTISTLHTSNSTTAIFRLERLGVARGAMADTILGIVAQRLIQKLCDNCKTIGPPTEEEITMACFSGCELPAQLARPVGCPLCGRTGYWGREAVYEIIEFTPEIARMIRDNKPISEIRTFIQGKGHPLIGHYALEKIKELKFSLKSVYEDILIEELQFVSSQQQAEYVPLPKKETLSRNAQPSILIVDDDPNIQILVKRLLENRGYEVTTAGDGVEALLYLGKKNFDLVLSDVNMPNLDGFKLLELMNQKGLKSRVIFLTGFTEADAEVKGFELGAFDYIKKPLQKDTLILRIQNALKP